MEGSVLGLLNVKASSRGEKNLATLFRSKSNVARKKKARGV